ncbi:MAG: TRAM domain-containing protein [Spirochaetes bacterium]|nr:MAG: TRAM domain-containing protein [Spirochaetota bacterium]
MVTILRAFFIFSSTVFTGWYFTGYSWQAALIGAVVAAVAALALIIVIEYMTHTVSPRVILAAALGLLAGLVIGHFLAIAFTQIPLGLSDTAASVARALLYHVVGFAVMLFFVIKSDDMRFLDKLIADRSGEEGERGASYKILDTSVIIDGRIADICDSGFIEGILVIPNFVLNELQMIADSADSIKRNRGRRGLDILNKMQKDQSIMVKISDMDFAELSEVDAKLVKLAKIMKAIIITNDFNLNKVAEFHGVRVLNINQLSNALKPIVLPGEEMRVALIKEGKDPNQAIGYLDDGTMVVVENGRRRMGNEVEVTVTSVLQTTAGRMIFARVAQD